MRVAHYQTIIDGLYRGRSTKEKIKQLIGGMYKYAMQNDIVNKSYAEFIRLEKKTKEEKQIFTDVKIKRLWENEQETYSILILIYTGFRIQEMLNLTKFNIDLKNNIITGDLKTENGKNRVIPIHSKILHIIKILYDEAYDLIFFKGDNEPITQNYYRKYIYYPLLEKLNINRKTPHATRHTFASLLARNQADTEAIKKLVGYSKYSFTADMYTHTDTNSLKKAIEKI